MRLERLRKHTGRSVGAIFNLTAVPSFLEDLRKLRVAPLRLTLQTTGPFHVPMYKGALFRGGFGRFFRDLVCQTRMPTCQGCPHLEVCPYSTVFETPVIAERFTVLRKYPNAPHPFVLAPPLDARTFVPARSELNIGLTLIGYGIEAVPHFVRAFQAMGDSGCFGGPFQIKRLTSAIEPLASLDASAPVVPDSFLLQPQAETPNVGRVHLRFLTPLRLRTDGRYNSAPTFVHIFQALLRRLHLLSVIFGGGAADAAALRPLLARADAVATKSASFRLFEWSRTSGRQKRRIDMDGVLGDLTAEGEIGELIPFLRAGEWLHVGSGTSMGMGKYQITELKTA